MHRSELFLCRPSASCNTRRYTDMSSDATPTDSTRTSPSTSKSTRIAPADGQQASPAGLGRRAVAFLVDMVIVWVGAMLATYFLVAVASRFAGGDDSEYGGLFAFLAGVLVLLVLFLALPVVYGSLSTSSTMQATPGKSIMKLAVVRATSGQPLDGYYAALRAVVLWLSLFSGYILAFIGIPGGLLLVPLVPAVLLGVALSRSDRRSLHDQFADTRVIYDPRHTTR